MDMMWYRRRGLMVTPHIESVTGSIASFNSDYNKIPVKSLICDIEPIQEGEGDPSPENVRPISGRTGAKVARTGKNLLDLSSLRGGHFDAPASSFPVLNICTGEYTPIKGGQSYMWSQSLYSDGSSSGRYVRWYDSLKNIVGTESIYTASAKVIQSPANAVYARFMWYQASYFNSIDEIIAREPQFELGSIATDYEPYQGDEISVNWETEVGTVYGGMLDVVSGKLTVDRAIKVFDGSENWYSYPAFSGYYTFINAMKQGMRESGICNMLKCSTTSTSPQTNAIWFGVNTKYIYVLGVYDSMGSTLEDFKTYLSEHNLKAVYPLETTTEIQLTPQEVRTLLGVNNIWCDSGDVTVDYWKWGK